MKTLAGSCCFSILARATLQGECERTAFGCIQAIHIDVHGGHTQTDVKHCSIASIYSFQLLFGGIILPPH
jgi:hypothetical protein